jgi:hypothetical protein
MESGSRIGVVHKRREFLILHVIDVKFAYVVLLRVFKRWKLVVDFITNI